MNKLIAILVLLSLYTQSFAVETLTERRVASLTRGIDLMTRETKLYQTYLADVMRFKMTYAKTDVDFRNANTRIDEINSVLESLAKRIKKAEEELKSIK